MKTPHLIGTEEAARILGVTARRVRQICASGRLPARLVGKTWTIDASQLEEAAWRLVRKQSGPRGHGKR